MTTLHENEDDGLVDDRLIDRLVDGALSDAERRRVLNRLDAEPDGWRRCALAFLEAQSWSEALGPLVTRESAVRVVPVQERRRFGVLRRMRSFAAIAAGLLAAFAVGWSVRGIQPAGAPDGAHGKPVNRVMVQAPSPAVFEKPPVDPRPEPIRTSSPSAAPLPGPVVRAWERRGYQVQRSQRQVSMQLQNGRRVAVPIDEVQLRFIGDRTY
jgi:hypothetical protein